MGSVGSHCDCGHGWYLHSSDGCAHLNGHDEYCLCSTKPPGLAEKERENRRQRALLYPCKEHPRYQVTRKPTGACEKCWRLWIAVNP